MPVFTLHQGGMITVHKRLFFIQRAAKCGSHNSVKLGPVFTRIGLKFLAEKPGIIHCKHVKTTKHMLLFVLHSVIEFFS